MKKIISLALALFMVLIIGGCTAVAPNEKTPATEKDSNKIMATIKTNSGAIKQMTLQEIKEIAETNSILFESEYVGADISVTSTITKIGGAFRLTSWFDCDAYIELEANSIGCFFKPITEAYAKTLNVGDTVTVSGKIGMASAAGLDIYILKDKISPY